MPFSAFNKVHVEELKAGDRIWFSDNLCIVIGVEPETDPIFKGCFRVYTEQPTASGRDYIYAFPEHEFLTPRPGQRDDDFIHEVARALEVMAARSAAAAAAAETEDNEMLTEVDKARPD